MRRSLTVSSKRNGSAKTTILIAGIGNIFLGDDAFGVEVVKELVKHPLPDEVQVVDFGIRGFDLAYALLEDYEAAILVDAVPRGEKPGTLFVIEPDLEQLDDADLEDVFVETHGMNPTKVLHLVRQMGGGGFGKLLLVGCEPATLGPEEGKMGLSEPVRSAVDGAIELIESLVKDILSGDNSTQTLS